MGPVGRPEMSVTTNKLSLTSEAEESDESPIKSAPYVTHSFAWRLRDQLRRHAASSLSHCDATFTIPLFFEDIPGLQTRPKDWLSLFLVCSPHSVQEIPGQYLKLYRDHLCPVRFPFTIH